MEFSAQLDDAADCEPILSLVERLIQLIDNESERLLDFALLLEPRVHHGYEFYSELKTVFEDIVDSPDDESEAKEFFELLRYEHDRHTSNEEWFKALGATVECVLAQLLERKYQDTSEAVFYREHKVTLLPSEISLTMNKPIDAIVWMESESCGEFMEVKKHFNTLGNKKIVSKIREMNELKDKVQRHRNVTSFVGFGTLAVVENPYERFLSLLTPDFDLQIDTVTYATIHEWLRSKVAA